MENISLIQDTGMNIDNCHICNKQKKKLLKLKATIPTIANDDLTIIYKLNVFICSDCLKVASEHIYEH